ncbi:hypothetical protein [uncultured Roseobacter sp.]|uniref:hypothetical protein n=1 Tax=uncultured Roseobacter sp. TaxID=114847 RepID=UPI002615E602|nr:hypothetical protein [uncultured Roseobacter sp.]
MRVFAALLLICLGQAAMADGSRFYPPEGCTGFLTVQNRSCEVTNYWTCEGEAAGDQWSIDLGPDGPIYLSKIDYETQWIDSYEFSPVLREQIVLPAKDPASFTDLLRDGVDTFDFQLSSPEGISRVVGADRIVERGIEIDGEPLMRTEYAVRVTAADGTMIWEAEGYEYISEKHRRFFTGLREGRDQNGSYSYDGSPVDFIYPGEPGFFSKTPLYGCAALTVRYAPN